MKVTELALPGVLLIEPRVFADERGYFKEAWNERRYAEAGVPTGFVQDNVSRSTRGTLRGLHFQQPNAQGKLVSVPFGAVYDVVVDVRSDSPHFGRWLGVVLSGDDHRQLWVPPGFAHGFLVTSDEALFAYKVTAYHHAESERTIAWDDPELGIEWPIRSPLLSFKDANAGRLRELPADALPSIGAAAPA